MTNGIEQTTGEQQSGARRNSPDVNAADETPNPIASRSAAGRPPRRSSMGIAILASLAVLACIYFARAFLMPIVLAMTLTLLYRPLVRRLRRYHIPETVTAALALAVTVVAIGGAASYFVDPAKEWIDNAPHNFRDAGAKLRVVVKQFNLINDASNKMQQMVDGDVGEASEQTSERLSQSDSPAVDGESTKQPDDDKTSIERGIAAEDEPPDEVVSKPVPVEVHQPRMTTGLAFLSSTGSVVAEIVVTLVLTFFLLTSGDVLINNVLKILPTTREKRNTVELVYAIERSISRYLLTVTCINVALGCTVGVSMWMLELPNPALWGAMATVFNFVPFLGALVGTVVVFVVAILSFDSLAYAALVPIVYFLLTALEGNVITPHVLGRSMSLNPILVFLSLTFWGWMWGIGGAIVAVPILAALKAGCDQFQSTKPIGTLLGG